jgi:hypothetical protein
VGNARGQDWKYVYTAITRGRKHVFIVGKPSELKAAVATQSIRRRSRLSRRLTESIATISLEVSLAIISHFLFLYFFRIEAPEKC